MKRDYTIRTFIIGILAIPLLPLILFLISGTLNEIGLISLTLFLWIIIAVLLTLNVISLIEIWTQANKVADWLERSNHEFIKGFETTLRCIGYKVKSLEALDNNELSGLVHKLMRDV